MRFGKTRADRNRVARHAGNKRTTTINRFVTDHIARTGQPPSVEETAKIMAISVKRTEQHFRTLGLL